MAEAGSLLAAQGGTIPCNHRNGDRRAAGEGLEEGLGVGKPCLNQGQQGEREDMPYPPIVMATALQHEARKPN